MANARLSDLRPLAVHDVRYSKHGLPLWVLIEYERDLLGWTHRNYLGSIELGERDYDCRCRRSELICRDVTVGAQPR